MVRESTAVGLCPQGTIEMNDKLYTQKEVDDLQRLAQAAALKEAADALTRKHHADFSIGVARAREIVLNCAPSDQPLLAQHDVELEMKAHKAGFDAGFEGAERAAFEREREYVTRLRAEAAAVMEAIRIVLLTWHGGNPKERMIDSISALTRIESLIRTDYADALAQELAKARKEGAFDILTQIRSFRKQHPMDSGAADTLEFIGNLYYQYEKSLRSAVHRAAPDTSK